VGGTSRGGLCVVADDGGTGTGNGCYIYLTTTSRGTTTDAERLRITSTGDFLLGGTLPSAPNIQLGANGRVAATVFTGSALPSNGAAIYAANTAVTDGSYRLFAGWDNSWARATFYVFSNGNVQNLNNSYAGISDAKLKENIVDASSQWDDIKRLQVRKYNLISDPGKVQLGLVAQEVETISPGLVSESKDLDKDGNDLGTTTKSVNYSVLYMKAVKALQEAMERIEALEARLAAAGIA
jgi:hypothetical protein